MKKLLINIRLYVVVAFFVMEGFLLLSGFCAISEFIFFVWMMMSFILLACVACILEDPQTKAEEKISNWSLNVVKWFINENEE